jgi:hypothetical protein
MNVLGSQRCNHRGLSVWLVLVLLFTQFATVSYACPNGFPREGLPEATAMPECEGSSGAMDMDPEQPLLCQASCNDGAQASAFAALADFPPSAVLLYVLPRVDLQDRLPPRLAYALPAAGQPPPGWPPAYLLNRILLN